MVPIPSQQEGTRGASLRGTFGAPTTATYIPTARTRPQSRRSGWEALGGPVLLRVPVLGTRCWAVGTAAAPLTLGHWRGSRDMDCSEGVL